MSNTIEALQFIVFGQPVIEEEEINEVVDTLKTAWLGTGPKVARFERDFAAYKEMPYAAALYSCTAGLHLSCLALNLEEGDEVITTANTFCATVNAIIHSGATPVLADIDPVTLNIDPKSIEQHITPRTRAIIPVHFAGRPCDMDAIMAIAQKHNLYVIEDCAHAIETEYRGKKAGSFGDLGVYSFYATKNLATGEGGMVLSSNEQLISKIKTLGLHGMSRDAWKRFSDAGYKHYYVEEAGFKYNMMDLQAAIGIHQLKKVEQFYDRRMAIWQYYMEQFRNLPIGLPAAFEADTRHALHLFTVRLQEDAGISRDGFLDAMTEKRIGVGVHYQSIVEHPFYQREFGWDKAKYPHSVAYGQQTVSIPLSPKLTDGDVERIAASVKSIF